MDSGVHSVYHQYVYAHRTGQKENVPLMPWKATDCHLGKKCCLLIFSGPLCLMQKPLLCEANIEGVCTPIGIHSACIKCYIPLWRPHTVFIWQFINEKEKVYPLQ